jgi:hypothetical protein
MAVRAGEAFFLVRYFSLTFPCPFHSHDHIVRWHDAFHEDDDTDDEPSDNAAAAADDGGDDGDLQDFLGVVEEAVVQGSYGLDETGPGLAGTSTSTSGTQVLFGHASGTHLPRPDAPAFFGIGATRSAIMEEAFRRAQEASYTAGYWTAVYQMHASQQVR